MAFFTFNQNNSGGVFDGAHCIIIEAANADWANDLALDHGIYFDGCSLGWDCDCCGDRWSRVSSYDATEVPSLYGEPIMDAAGIKIVRSSPPA